MAYYDLAVVSWDGHSLQTADYEAYFEAKDDVLSTYPVRPVDIARAFKHPKHVGEQPSGKVFPVHITLKDSDQAKLNTLKYWFRAGQGEKYLRCTDGDGNTVRLSCASLGLLETPGNPVEFVARLYAPEPIWEEDTEQSDTQSGINTSPEDWSITGVKGSEKTYPTIEFTPTASKDHDDCYKRRIQLIIANKVPRPLTSTDGRPYPIDVVDDGLAADDLITASQLQADADDLRLFLDGKNLKDLRGEDIWQQDKTSHTAQVWANGSWKPRRTATLDGVMTANSPANGGSISTNTPGGFRGWPQSGFFVIDNECIYYASRTSDTVDNITREVRNTTADSHADGTAIYRVEKEAFLLHDYPGAAAPPGSDDLKPVIGLDSTNALWKYPGPLYVPSSQRSGQWRPYYSEDNVLSALLSLEDTGTLVKFLDAAVAAGKWRFDNLELYVPCMVKAAANALKHDVAFSGGEHLLARLYGRDEDGNKSLLASYYEPDAGAGKQVTPTDELVRIWWKAVHCGIVGCFFDDGDIADGNGQIEDDDRWRGQGFTLDQATTIAGIAVRLKKGAGVTGTLRFNFYIAEGTDYEDERISGTLEFTIADLTTSYATYVSMFSTPIVLPAGTYYLQGQTASLAGGSVYWATSGERFFAGGFDVTSGDDGSTWNERYEESRWFAILGNGTVAQEETPSGSGDYFSLDNDEITIDTPPYVHVCASEEIYAYKSARLENLTTGQYIDIHFVSALNEKLTIDCKTMRVTGGELGLEMPYAVDWSDEAEGLYLVPGTNSLRYTEMGIGTLGIVTKRRGRWG